MNKQLDEIIEKLRRRDPYKKPPPPTPKTARIDRDLEQAKRPITPPPLEYYSPVLSNRFHSSIPEWIHPPHDCAASLEVDAFSKIKSRYHGLDEDKIANPLVNNDLNELQQTYEFARTITPENS